MNDNQVRIFRFGRLTTQKEPVHLHRLFSVGWIKRGGSFWKFNFHILYGMGAELLQWWGKIFSHSLMRINLNKLFQIGTTQNVQLKVLLWILKSFSQCIIALNIEQIFAFSHLWNFLLIIDINYKIYSDQNTKEYAQV